MHLMQKISIHFLDSASIYNSGSLLSTETMDTTEDNFAFDSIITEVGSLASCSASNNLSLYNSDCEIHTEKYDLTDCFHEEK